MQSRLDYIDIAKGIGILLVALGHNRAFTENVSGAHAFIYLFHMPLFFFLSGITTPTILSRKKLTQRLQGLLKPYIAGTLIFLPRQLAYADHPSNTGLVKNIFWGSGNAIYNTPLWFFVALMSGYTLYSLVQLFRRHFNQENSFPLMGLTAIIASYWLLENQIFFGQLPTDELNRPIGAPLNLDLTPLVLGILLIGNWWGEIYKKMPITDEKPLFLTLLLCGLSYIYIFSLGPDLDLNYRSVKYWLLALTSSALGITATISLSILLAKQNCIAKDLLVFLGRNTLIILIFHAAIQGNIIRILPQGLSDNAALNAAISSSICLTLAWISEKIINKHKFLRALFYVNK